MASIFTYQDEPHRVHSPWSTPGSSTPQIAVNVQGQPKGIDFGTTDQHRITKLEPEKHDGPIEYKLHLLLRWRRIFTYSSTTMPVWTNQQNRLETASASSPSTSDGILVRSTYQPSTQTRQARLQQLTTQLLWRLQQSSPFHSSSNAKLVLPVLPEATPRLGIPDRPLKLLPGLEESQGALYEIGVADNGTLVGLADEELEESLTNLRAMAASLGCVVDVHRRVIVGDCEWVEEVDGSEKSITRSSQLWVAEVLVRPDNKSVEIVPAKTTALEALSMAEDAGSGRDTKEENLKQHLRVALVGASAAGKSSLLGTLTTSALDNGRGKSRLSLLKHRHEIASGITSSVAQELLGYGASDPTSTAIVNYATGDVSSWPDIHNLADYLVFLSDSPGLPRYSKSTFRASISWDPAWTILCIPADEDMRVMSHPAASGSLSDHAGQHEVEPSLSFAHLDLCLKLGRLFVVTITKLDLATKTGLRQVLAHILSIVKAAGKMPVLVNSLTSQNLRKDDTDFATRIDQIVSDEQIHVENKLAGLRHKDCASMVPIVMTSAVTGSGIGTLHAMLRTLPLATKPSTPHPGVRQLKDHVIFRTDEVFAIPPSKVYSTPIERTVLDNGVVLCGVLDAGTILLGDEVFLGPFLVEADTGEVLQAQAFRRASSYQNKPLSQSLPRSLSENFSKSLLSHNRQSNAHEPETKVRYVKVRVVSLRNLRLPVSAMHAGDTGTVGIQAISAEEAPQIRLDRARKGMILTKSPQNLHGYSSFTASFPHSDFGGSGSPPLILGGHAIAYTNSIRAAVKVIAVALEDHETPELAKEADCAGRGSSHDEVFSFEDDEDDHYNHAETLDENAKAANLRISFRFVTTVEYLQADDQVLIVPNVTPAGPVTGPPSTSTIAGFSGFVGRIVHMDT